MGGSMYRIYQKNY